MKQLLSMIVIAGTFSYHHVQFLHKGRTCFCSYFTVQLSSPPFSHLRISSSLPTTGLIMDPGFTLTPLKTLLLQLMQVVTAL